MYSYLHSWYLADTQIRAIYLLSLKTCSADVPEDYGHDGEIFHYLLDSRPGRLTTFK